jgi:hypothetical protein
MEGRKNIYGLLKLKPSNRFVGLDLICFLSPPSTISIGLYPNYGLSFDKYLITDGPWNFTILNEMQFL